MIFSLFFKFIYKLVSLISFILFEEPFLNDDYFFSDAFNFEEFL